MCDPKKNCSVWICIKPKLVLSYFGWVGSPKEKIFQSVFVSSQNWCYLILGWWVGGCSCGNISGRYIKSNLVLSYFGWVGVSVKNVWIWIWSSQIWCYLILGGWAGGWMVSRKKFWVQIYVKPNLVLSHFGWVVSRKFFSGKFVSSQMWRAGGSSWETFLGLKLSEAKSGIIPFLGRGCGKQGGVCKWPQTYKQPY